MNYDMYKNQTPYPRKEDFCVTYFYSQGRVLAKATTEGEVRKARSEFPSSIIEIAVDEVAFKNAKAKYSALSNALEEKFTVALFEDHGIPDDEFSRAIYRIAYSLGHSNGFSEIASHFEEMSSLHTLARKVFAK